jgi:hypothetical protein
VKIEMLTARNEDLIMTRQSDTLEYLVTLAAQFPATLLRIMERDSEHVELTGGIAVSTQTREVQS